MHETESVEIKPGKFAEVDKGVTWLVQWLNSFEEIETIFSCEAEYDAQMQVLFKCNSMQRLSWFLKFLEGFRLSLPRVIFNGRELEIAGATYCGCSWYSEQCEEGEVRIHFRIKDFYVSQFQNYVAQHSPENKSQTPKIESEHDRRNAHESHQSVCGQLEKFDCIPNCDLILKIRED